MNNRVFPWAVVAALQQELAPLKRRFQHDLVLIETGMGCENADRSLRARLREQHVAAVLGIGLAGALSSSLEIGDLVIGQEVWGRTRITPPASLVKAARETLSNDSGIHLGSVITVNKMVCTTEGKRQLATSLGVDQLGCVDMESWAVARVCEEIGIPYLIVRCISDVLSEDLPLDFNRFCLPDGNLDIRRIMRSAFLHPSKLQGLWKFARRLTLCTSRLAEFADQFVSRGAPSALER